MRDAAVPVGALPPIRLGKRGKPTHCGYIWVSVTDGDTGSQLSEDSVASGIERLALDFNTVFRSF